MEKLNELVRLAHLNEKASAWSEIGHDLMSDGYHDTASDFIEACSPDAIIEIAEEFRALEQRAEAAEREAANAKYEWGEAQANYDSSKKVNSALRAKLAELDKQKPVAYVMGEETIDDFNSGYEFFAVRDAEHEEEMDNIPLFTRPAPAIDLAELVPDKWYFQLTFGIPNLDGMTPYQAHGAAWEQCRAAILRNIEVVGNAGKDGSHE